MCDNRAPLKDYEIYQETTILTSTILFDTNGYEIRHDIKNIVKDRKDSIY